MLISRTHGGVTVTEQELQAAYATWMNRMMVERAVLFKKLVAQHGPEILATVAQHVSDQARDAMQSADLESRDLQAVLDTLWNNIGDQADFTIEEQTPTRLGMRVTRCALADTMRAHDAADVGLAFFCAYDAGFCQGLNPALTFTRTKTLMAGDDCCDHTYELPEAE
jgi:hypothetical protein